MSITITFDQIPKYDFTIPAGVYERLGNLFPKKEDLTGFEIGEYNGNPVVSAICPKTVFSNSDTSFSVNNACIRL
ncbi:MAG: hypothetical protein V1870_03550 [Candidatus Aenigmatarchaeota archaeon]